MEMSDRQLEAFKVAYLALAVLVGLLGLAVHFLLDDDLIALALIVLASVVVLVGSWLWARFYWKRKFKD